MQWLLYLPAIAAPIAVVAAYALLKASAKSLKKRLTPAPAAAHVPPADNPFGDIIVDGAAEYGNISVSIHKEHA